MKKQYYFLKLNNDGNESFRALCEKINNPLTSFVDDVTNTVGDYNFRDVITGEIIYYPKDRELNIQNSKLTYCEYREILEEEAKSFLSMNSEEIKDYKIHLINVKGNSLQAYRDKISERMKINAYYYVKLNNDDNENFRAICVKINNLITSIVDDVTNTVGNYNYLDIITGEKIYYPKEKELSRRNSKLTYCEYDMINENEIKKVMFDMKNDEEDAYKKHIIEVKNNSLKAYEEKVEEARRSKKLGKK